MKIPENQKHQNVQNHQNQSNLQNDQDPTQFIVYESLENMKRKLIGEKYSGIYQINNPKKLASAFRKLIHISTKDETTKQKEKNTQENEKTTQGKNLAKTEKIQCYPPPKKENYTQFIDRAKKEENNSSNRLKKIKIEEEKILEKPINCPNCNCILRV